MKPYEINVPFIVGFFDNQERLTFQDLWIGEVVPYLLEQGTEPTITHWRNTQNALIEAVDQGYLAVWNQVFPGKADYLFGAS